MKIIVNAYVRYLDDTTLNGNEDVNGEITGMKGNIWNVEINADNGQILDWRKGDIANTHYKVCDECSFDIYKDKKLIFSQKDDYVPEFLSPKIEGYGDYIIMDINELGFIDKWDKKEVEKYVNKGEK